MDVLELILHGVYWLGHAFLAILRALWHLIEALDFLAGLTELVLEKPLRWLRRRIW